MRQDLNGDAIDSIKYRLETNNLPYLHGDEDTFSSFFALFTAFKLKHGYGREFVVAYIRLESAKDVPKEITYIIVSYSDQRDAMYPKYKTTTCRLPSQHL